MKKLIIILTILFIPSIAGAAIARVQAPSGGNNCGSVTSCTIAFASNTAAGNFIAVTWRYSGGGRTVTLSDTGLNTYTSNAIEAIDTGDASATTGIGFSMNIAGGADTVTFATSGAANTKRFVTAEYSGVATSAALDKTAQAIGLSTAPASGAVTPTTDGQLFVAVTHTSDVVTFTAGTDFSLITTVPTTAGSQRLGAEDYVQPTAASHNGNFSTNTSFNWGAALATFKAAAPASGLKVLIIEGDEE